MIQTGLGSLITCCVHEWEHKCIYRKCSKCLFSSKCSFCPHLLKIWICFSVFEYKTSLSPSSIWVGGLDYWQSAVFAESIVNVNVTFVQWKYIFIPKSTIYRLYNRSIFSSLSEIATDHTRPAEDWTLILEICDMINETDEG